MGFNLCTKQTLQDSQVRWLQKVEVENKSRNASLGSRAANTRRHVAGAGHVSLPTEPNNASLGLFPVLSPPELTEHHENVHPVNGNLIECRSSCSPPPMNGRSTADERQPLVLTRLRSQLKLVCSAVVSAVVKLLVWSWPNSQIKPRVSVPPASSAGSSNQGFRPGVHLSQNFTFSGVRRCTELTLHFEPNCSQVAYLHVDSSLTFVRFRDPRLPHPGGKRPQNEGYKAYAGNKPGFLHTLHGSLSIGWAEARRVRQAPQSCCESCDASDFSLEDRFPAKLHDSQLACKGKNEGHERDLPAYCSISFNSAPPVTRDILNQFVNSSMVWVTVTDLKNSSAA
ncbi:hypothetical protein C8R47DRAFT_1079209 [Mycena vitilis]|nr:hypothetical protein C8R47DRAFT_1079209 [Mycena vitilis]